MTQPFSVAALFDEDPSVPQIAKSVAQVSMADAMIKIRANLPTREDIDSLGKEHRDDYSKITDQLLDQHKTADLGEMGAKINELVVASKGFDPKQHKSGGLLNKVMNTFRNEREGMLSHMQSVKTRVEKIVTELDAMATLHKQRIQDLAGLQQANLAYHEGLKEAAFKGEDWLVVQAEELAKPIDPNDSFAAAKISALQQDNQRLQVSVNDFKNGMTLAKQQAIEIQMTTNNARSILEEFERAKTTVIPALKSLLAQHLISIEQKHAIETDNLLRETLASAMIAQTQLTSENTVQLATLQQKSTISVQTLDDCQKILEDTALKVKEIEEAGRKQRIEDATKRADIEKRLLASVRNS